MGLFDSAFGAIGGAAGSVTGGFTGGLGGSLGFLGGKLKGLFGGGGGGGGGPQGLQFKVPPLPGFQSGFGPGDVIAPGVQGALSGINVDTGALEQLRGEALRQSPSRFTQLQQAGNVQQVAGQLGQVGLQTAGQVAQARSGLAARGGLSGGASERIAQQGLRSNIGGFLGAAKQGANRNLGLLLGDESNRLASLRSQVGIEQGAIQPELQKLGIGTGAQQFDIGQQVTEAERQSQFDLNQFGIRSGLEAARLRAEAERQSQSGGGFLGGIGRLFG